MTYATQIDAVKAAVDAVSGLSYPDNVKRLETLEDLDSNAAFDGAFLLVDLTGPQPWPEITNDPTNWWARIRLEVGTQIDRDQIEARKTVATRGQAIIEALEYDATVCPYVYQRSDPEILRVANNDNRLIWAIEFKMRYSE